MPADERRDVSLVLGEACRCLLYQLLALPRHRGARASPPTVFARVLLREVPGVARLLYWYRTTYRCSLRLSRVSRVRA